MDKTMKKELGIVGLIFVLLMFFEGYFFGNVINLNKDLGVFISIFGCLFLIMFLIAYIIVNNRIKMLDNKEILIENYTLKNEYNIIKTNDKYYLLEDDQVIIRAPKEMVIVHNDVASLDYNGKIIINMNFNLKYKTKLLIDYNDASGFYISR